MTALDETLIDMVSEVRTEGELLAVTQSVAESLGFPFFSGLFVIENGQDAEFRHVDNMPSVMSESTEIIESASRDPVMQHCKRSSIPIFWGQDTYIGAGGADLWEMQAEFGYKNGIAVPIHMPGNKHFVFGVDTDKDIIVSAKQKLRILADLSLFANYAASAAAKVYETNERRIELTNSEIEVLKWTKMGKTAWEVGIIMGIAERTAIFHIRNACKKLNVNNKAQAVIKCIASNLIY